MIPWLDEGDPFPPTSTARKQPNGLLCAGANLEPDRLFDAYLHGIFPWYSEGEPILWWSPTPRCVFLPGDFHASRSLQKRWRSGEYRISVNQHFAEVIHACATAGERAHTGTWISPDMQAAYTTLHTDGWAHSIEVHRNGQLMGGLYGLAIGQAFFGESMFSHDTDGSKLALWKLTQSLEAMGFVLFDCQVENPHLMSLGARCLPRSTFESQLANATQSLAGLETLAWEHALSELDT